MECPLSWCCCVGSADKPNVPFGIVPNDYYFDHNTQLADLPGPILLVNDEQHGEDILLEEAAPTLLVKVSHGLFDTIIRNFSPELPTIMYLKLVETVGDADVDIHVDMKRFFERSLPNLKYVEIWFGPTNSLGWGKCVISALGWVKKLEMLKLGTFDSPGNLFAALPNMKHLKILSFSSDSILLENPLNCPTLNELVIRERMPVDFAHVLDLSLLKNIQKLEVYSKRAVKAAPRNSNLRKLVLHGATSFDGDVSAVCVLELAQCCCSSQLIDACQPNLRELCLANPIEERSFVIDANALKVLILAGDLQSAGFVQEVSSSLTRPLDALLMFGPVFEASAYERPEKIHSLRLLLRGDDDLLPRLAAMVELSQVSSLAITSGVNNVVAVLSVLESVNVNLKVFATDVWLTSLPEMPKLQRLCLPNLLVFERLSPYIGRKLEEVAILSDFYEFRPQNGLVAKHLFGQWSESASEEYSSIYQFWIGNDCFRTSLPRAYGLE